MSETTDETTDETIKTACRWTRIAIIEAATTPEVDPAMFARLVFDLALRLRSEHRKSATDSEYYAASRRRWEIHAATMEQAVAAHHGRLEEIALAAT